VEPGFKTFTINPHPLGDLTWVRAEHRSPYGLIRSAWEQAEDAFRLEVEVPANTTARVYLHTSAPGEVTESGVPLSSAEGVMDVAAQEGHVAVQIGSGTYRFEVRKQPGS
jgi:alpha-L-rhamnosidase